MKVAAKRGASDRVSTAVIEPAEAEAKRAPRQRHVASGRPRTLPSGVVLHGRYQIQEVLGIGGMSTVYRARDLHFTGVERNCAIKEMFNSGDDVRLRQLRVTNFRREAGLLAELSHVAIPRIYDYFEHHDSIYLVLELVDGADLETLLSRQTEPFSETQLIQWSIELCQVLRYLHAWEPEPIVFRDLKPSNIMIRKTGMLTLVDFGIARVFAPDEKGTMIGTEGYAPPEQYKGEADVRGDIYALGATLHHLATRSDPRGEIPFTFAQRPPRQLNPDLSPEFERIILKAVSYSALDRFGSIDEFLDALRELQSGESQLPVGSGAVSAERRVPAAGSKLLSPPTAPVTLDLGGEDAKQRLAWIVATRDEVRGSAAYAGGAVYVGSYDGNLYALDETDGTVRWRHRCQRGVVSCPIPASDLVIFGSEDSSVYALSRQHGRQVWQVRATMPVRSSPRIDERSAFIGSDDGHLYRIDRSRGSVSWRYKTWGPVRATPLLEGENVLVASEDGYLYCVARETGQLVWRSQIGAGMVSSPAISAGVVVLGAADGAVRGVAADGGRTLWKHETRKQVVATAAIADDVAYIGSADGMLYALAVSSGEVRWATPLCRQITSTAAIDGRVLYVGGTDGFCYCLNREDGSVEWRFRTGGPIAARPLITDEHIIVGSFDGRIYALHRG